MIKSPPQIAAEVSGELSGGGRSWSTMATMKIVRRAATDERTGEVREIRARKAPENARLELKSWSFEQRSKSGKKTYWHWLKH